MNDIQPSFIGVHLTVADVKASVDFYRLIGLSLPELSEFDEHVEIDLGRGRHLALSNERIARRYDPAWRAPSGQTASALQFQVDSREAVDHLYKKVIAAGYHAHLAPVDAFWGNLYAEVDDPDGNIVGFHSPTDPGTRS